jgi:hypothetical protein
MIDVTFNDFVERLGAVVGVFIQEVLATCGHTEIHGAPVDGESRVVLIGRNENFVSVVGLTAVVRE